jgi:hypothetical protein
MTPPDTLDFDLITTLIARVGRLNAPDRLLGLEIVAASEPTSSEGEMARRLLDTPHLRIKDIPRGLDVTGSVDAAFAFYDRHLGQTEWSMFCMASQYPTGGQTRKILAEGPYHIQIETPGVLYCGDGWTRPTCIVGGVLRTLLPLHSEENASAKDVPIEDEILFEGLEGLIPTDPVQ